MNHTQFEELLAIYRDLHGSERALVDEHLQGCAECAARLRAYDAMDQRLAALRDPRPDSRLAKGFYAAIVRSSGRRRWHILYDWLRTPAALTPFVVMLLIIALGMWVLLSGQLPDNPITGQVDSAVIRPMPTLVDTGNIASTRPAPIGVTATPAPTEAPPLMPTPVIPTPIIYTVRVGDTLISIAQRYGISVEALLAANAHVSPERLEVGQQLIVPQPTLPPAPPPQPTLNPTTRIGGGTVQSGLFTFDLALYRDERIVSDMSQAPFPYLYSDLPGFGVYSLWTYHGPPLQGPVEELWGIEPDVQPRLAWPQIADGYVQGHPEGGILLPEGAQAGDIVRWLHKLRTPEGVYGAALQFTLYNGPKGLEPINITVQALEPIAVATSSSTSPDGRWTAQIVMEGPYLVGDDEKYRVILRLIGADGSGWTVLDEERLFGLGYDVPSVLQWSGDGRYLYFTNRPVPDGCALFVNGWDLQRVDLMDRQVTQLLPKVASALALSPDERLLAYITSGVQNLVIRDLQTGSEQRIRLPADQAGAIVWSPDATAFAITLAAGPCDPTHWIQSIARVDIATLTVTMLIRDAPQRYTTVAWPETGRIEVRDKNGKSWWLDAMTGALEEKN